MSSRARDIKDAMNTRAGQKILKHTDNCKHCKLLQETLGFLIEKHMEETEQLEALT